MPAVQLEGGELLQRCGSRDAGRHNSGAVVARIDAVLSEQGVSLADSPQADINELVEILAELGWSALERCFAAHARLR